MSDTGSPGRPGESDVWEAAYRLTRRSLGQRRARLARFAWPGGDARVLDLAAGDGLDMGLLRSLGAGRVIGLDISVRLLALATGPRVVADAHHLPFRDASLDGVLANSVLHHLDPEPALRELARVMRPGGTLVWMEPRPCVARSILDWVTLRFPPARALPLLRARGDALVEELDVYSRWLRLFPHVRGWLVASGFERVREFRTLVGVLAEWRRTG